MQGGKTRISDMALEFPCWFGVCLAAIALIGASGCDTAPPRGRVLLVGIDGATLRVIEPMMQAGELPVLSGIARDGVHGELKSFLPLRSPRIWTSIATGRLPEHHGIEQFRVDEGGPLPRLVAGFDRRGAALWNIVSEAGHPVGVVNWWVTYPPEVVDGVIISDHFIPEVVNGRSTLMLATAESGAPVVYPASWIERVEQIVEDRRAREDGEDHFAAAGLPDWVAAKKMSSWYENDATVGRMAREVGRAIEPKLLMVLLKGVDPASHLLWAAMEPEEERARHLFENAGEREAAVDALQEFYRHSDELLGVLLEDYGPDDLVVVVSDHGFGLRRKFTFMTGGHTNEAATRAVIFARGPGISPNTKTNGVTIYDIAPTILAFLDIAVANDMEGGPADFLDVDRIRKVGSYDDIPIERLGRRVSGNEEEILEHLEALGYFEDDEPAK
jgi:predicted AlkP superfamily phosphohydrolase/phosphomutase